MENRAFRKLMKCLEIARLQDFAPNTQGLLGALCGPPPPLPYRTNPPLKIFAYGPGLYLHLQNDYVIYASKIHQSIGIIGQYRSTSYKSHCTKSQKRC